MTPATTLYRTIPYVGIDWDNINRSKPPMKPARDINMATQSEIGAFNDEKQVSEERRREVLGPMQ